MNWYEDDVQGVIAEISNCPYEPKSIFYGSSSIRPWGTLYDDFKNLKPVNLGFGGSTLAVCVWFFDRIMAHRPQFLAANGSILFIILSFTVRLHPASP